MSDVGKLIRAFKSLKARSIVIPSVIFISLLLIIGCSTHFASDSGIKKFPDTNSTISQAEKKAEKEVLQKGTAKAPSVEDLKKTGWWTTVQKDIRAREYHIIRGKCTLLPEGERDSMAHEAYPGRCRQGE
jgi:hypothetical protein